MIEVTPLSPALGAEIRGVDLSTPLDQATVAAIRAAWLEHLVILFRGQALGVDDHLRFCQGFGAIELTRTTRRQGREVPGVLYVANRTRDGFQGILPDGEMQFHTDQCYYELPIAATTLFAIEIPAQGGNTLFANAYRAYESLPDALKARLDGLRALNVYDYAANATIRATEPSPDAPRYVHPVVRTHPETGRKAIYVNRLMTDHIVGLGEAESRALLEILFDAVERPEHIYEHAWRPGDLAMWDNRCTLHARTDFDPAEARVLRRVAVRGDRPY
jgi:alpha-ketoglutarate-dependent taurine dioxygenase